MKHHSVLRAFAFLIFSLVFCLSLQSQVFTRILNDKREIYNYIPWHIEAEPNPIITPTIDIEAVLEKDKKDKITFSRFGIKQPLNLNKEAGEFYQFGKYTVWKLKIQSLKAKSLNFEFSNLNIPEGSEMFIYGMDEKMIQGPIHSNNIHKGNYSSDIIYGNTAIIEILLPTSVADLLSISVDNFIYGISNFGEGSRDIGGSLACNINVACSEGSGWENEIKAVCILLRNNEFWCTGTLINNECNDFRPFILTGKHCVDNFENYEWVYRFNFQSTTCTPNTVTDESVWISFSGADLRASWDESDFALLELFDPLIGISGLTFAGWDRSGDIPENSTMIHHPQGDLKKITFDSESPETETHDVAGGTLTAIIVFELKLIISRIQIVMISACWRAVHLVAPNLMKIIE